MKLVFKNELTIALLAAILFIPFLGLVHLFDWDEINFAESAREMIVTGNYFSVQINFERFYEKPPLFFWLQVISMKTFGVNEFAARFPNALCGILTLVILFRTGKRLFSENFGRIWVMVYLGTFLSFLYFKSGIIDPWFNLFIFLGIYHFYFLATKEKINRAKYAFFTGIFLGLAVLTKGPVAIIISALAYFTYVIVNRFKFFINWKELLTIVLVIVGVCFLWFGVDLINNGPWFLAKFIQYQIRLLTTGEAGHDEPFFYHWWVLLVGCFPASVFFIKGMFVKPGTTEQKEFKNWMLILFWVTLILFSIVKTKIVHYSSLCWFPLTFLASLCIYELWEKKYRLNKWLVILMGIIGITLSLVIVAIPFAMINKNKWIDKVGDAFARANLAANVKWHWFDSMGGLVLLSGVFIYFISKNQIAKTVFLFASVTLCCFINTVLIVPKIEAISQRANIGFFKARQGEDCYTATAFYKSYAPYFYTRKMPFQNKQSTDVNWLMHGPVDKPAYISTRIQYKSRIDTIPGMKLLYEQNGFVFFKRFPVITR
jgi:4-amino-4-deoxy-L-arabinose transferase-like glycosyltransferase